MQAMNGPDPAVATELKQIRELLAQILAEQQKTNERLEAIYATMPPPD